MLCKRTIVYFILKIWTIFCSTIFPGIGSMMWSNWWTSTWSALSCHGDRRSTLHLLLCSNKFEFLSEIFFPLRNLYPHTCSNSNTEVVLFCSQNYRCKMPKMLLFIICRYVLPNSFPLLSFHLLIKNIILSQNLHIRSCISEFILFYCNL